MFQRATTAPYGSLQTVYLCTPASGKLGTETTLVSFSHLTCTPLNPNIHTLHFAYRPLPTVFVPQSDLCKAMYCVS